jgi:hypothetical protein
MDKANLNGWDPASNGGQSSGSFMNQSFGFGPLQVSKMKYGSQERGNINQSVNLSGKKGILKPGREMRSSVQENTRLPNI